MHSAIPLEIHHDSITSIVPVDSAAPPPPPPISLAGFLTVLTFANGVCFPTAVAYTIFSVANVRFRPPYRCIFSKSSFTCAIRFLSISLPRTLVPLDYPQMTVPKIALLYLIDWSDNERFPLLIKHDA